MEIKLHGNFLKLFVYLFFLFGPTLSSALQLKIALPSRLDNYDPAKVWSTYEQFLTSAYCSTLVRIGQDGELRGHLLEKWSISEDLKTYTFFLKDKVYFHNGDQLCSDDVRFSISRHFWKSINSGFKRQLEYAFGKNAYLDDGKYLDSIKILGKLKFEVTLPSPYIPFLPLLSQSGLCILKDNDPLVGSGPMVIGRQKIDNAWILTKFENYFEGNAKIDSAQIFSVLDGQEAIDGVVHGKYDIAIGSHLLDKRIPSNFTIGALDFHAINHFFLNSTDTNLGTKEKRRLIGLLLQRIAWNPRNIMKHHKPAESILPEGLFARKGKVSEINYENLLASLKTEFSSMVSPLKFVFVGRHFRIGFYKDLSNALTKIGVKFQIRIIEGPEYNKVLKEGYYSVSHLPLTFTYYDPDSLFLEVDELMGIFSYEYRKGLSIFRNSSDVNVRNKGYLKVLSDIEEEWIIVPAYDMKIPVFKAKSISFPDTKYRSIVEFWKAAKLEENSFD